MNFLSPQFFDIFGAIAFLFLISASSWLIRVNHKAPRWLLIAILILGITGFLVDTYFVTTTYVLP